MNTQSLTYSTPRSLASSLTEPSWYAGYTYPKAEKKVYEKIRKMGLDAFLPLMQVVRQWSDRKKKMEEPLFPNYVFIKTAAVRRFDLFHIQELVRFVMFDNQPVAIPEEEINDIKKLLKGDVEVYDNDFNYKAGERVRVVYGPFTGAEGFLVKVNGKKRLVVRIEVLQKLISVEVGTHCVRPVA